jgi:predicted RNA binding protein YcfA (HicA-like mRNA interferase family)
LPRLTPVHWRTLVALFEKEGYVTTRHEGDHIVMVKAGSLRPVVIPEYQQVPVFIIKNNPRTAGISRDRHFELLASL